MSWDHSFNQRRTSNMQRSIGKLAAIILVSALGCDRPQEAPTPTAPAISATIPASAAASASVAAPAGPPAQVRTQAPGFYRMMLGDFEITALSDGTASLPMDKLLTHAKPGEVEALLGRTHQTSPLDVSINAFLINTGSKLILIDTGAGEVFGPKVGGKVPQSIRAAGYTPEQVDAVLVTHVHGDHSGGLVVAGKMIFPRARVYMHKRDREFWLSPTEAERARSDEKQAFEQAHKVLDPYIAADKVSTFDDATELFPGIKTIPSPGHTPGHTFYAVESKGQKIVFWGDLVHVAEVQFADPAVTIQFDHVPDEAATQRAKIFADAAKQGYLIGAPHISFPGLGRIYAEGSGYVWSPAPYSNP